MMLLLTPKRGQGLSLLLNKELIAQVCDATED
jgi:hypothetical protein